ncbi:CoA transferase [Amycolatopsis acidiphila]|uniref:CoA transferase n=1 Tax=Amycolatopsis acidiphila TaxID=715473 RepID=A0A557ZZJ8_9PSEU|nr:CoA transferase [Amycolatopsis acidiphila]TVT17430.1 CoA transferase [Amycolatopsis acidiphila]UIJ57276.1 CoA transferase [Amycolatopsis acidiphila]
MSSTSPAPPLAGLLVVDVSTTLPGAQATQFLADAGADVVQVEPPGGSPLRRNAGWPVFARGKRSIELDLHEAADQEVLDGLLARADVLVAAGRPQALRRRGLTAERLSALNPRLVSATITGWGSSGPWADLKGYEGMVLAKLGMFHNKRLMVSRPGPAFISVPFASWGAAHTALQGVLSALLERETSGRGQHIEADLVRGVAMMDTWQWNAELIALRWPGAYETVDAYTPEGEPRGHMLFPLLVAPTKDGTWLQFAQVEPRLFVGMLEEFGLGWMLTDPQWKGIPRFDDQARKSKLWEIMLAKVGERTLAEWQEAFARNPNLSAEAFRAGPEILDHPQLAHDGRVVVVDDPDLGPVRQPSTLVHAGERPLSQPRPAPRLGADAEAVRALAARPSEPAAPVPAPAGALPLAGVTILELGLMFAAPFGSTMLADLGARVIKIESLQGDTIRNVLPFPESGGARVMQGKESICVDLSTEDGRRIVHELARRADVVLQSFRAGAAARAGVDAATLCELNPDLVYVNAPGYGSGGPYGAKPAYAPSIGAATGIALTEVPGAASATGTMDQIKEGSRLLNQACAVPSLQADGIAALGVASTMLLGLLARARGRALDELTATMIGTVGHALAERATDYFGRPDGPVPDAGATGFSALYRMYPASEGWVFLAAPAPGEWAPLAEALRLDDPRFGAAEGRREHDGALAETLARIFATRPAGEWEQELTAADIGCVQVHEGSAELQLQADEALAAEYAASAVSPIFEESLRMGTPVRFSRSRTRAPGGCLAGDHTDALLAELGYDETAIADLRDRKVIG